MAENAINLLLDPEECRIETEDCQKLPLLDLFKLIGNLGLPCNDAGSALNP